MSMAIGERELSVILQACIEHARERLEEGGGFLPFGARARQDGEIEFLEATGQGGQPLDDVHRGIARTIGDEASRGELLAAALVANAALPAGFDSGFTTAIAVQLEAPAFCRSVVVPYRIAAGRVELAALIPEPAAPTIFPG